MLQAGEGEPGSERLQRGWEGKSRARALPGPEEGHASLQQHHMLCFLLHRGFLLRATAPGRGKASALPNLDGICRWSFRCHLCASIGFGYQVPTGVHPSTWLCKIGTRTHDRLNTCRSSNTVTSLLCSPKHMPACEEVSVIKGCL